MNIVNDPLVTFRTAANWAFNVPEGLTPPSWGGDRYKNDFAPGDRLSVPQSIAETRQAAGLGEIVIVDDSTGGEQHAG